MYLNNFPVFFYNDLLMLLLMRHDKFMLHNLDKLLNNNNGLKSNAQNDLT